MFGIFTRLRRAIVRWALSEKTVTVGQLVACHKMQSVDIAGPDGHTKFVRSGDSDGVYVQTPTGYAKVVRLLETVPYQVHTVELDNGMALDCADEHIVIDGDGAEVYAKDVISGSTVLRTTSGPSLVRALRVHDVFESMYDLELGDDALHGLRRDRKRNADRAAGG